MEYRVAELEADLEDAEEWSGEEEEEGAVSVTLTETMQGGMYDAPFRFGAQQLGLDFNIPGNRLRSLLVRFLALMTNLREDEVERHVCIPSTSTIYRDTIVYQQLRMDNLEAKLRLQKAVCVLFDGGDAGNQHRVSTLLAFPGDPTENGEQRPILQILGVPEQVDRTARGHADSITRALGSVNLSLVKVVAVVRDATAVNPAAVGVLAQDKKHLIDKLIESEELLAVNCDDERLDGAYFASVQAAEELLPTGIVFLQDATHGFKNGELKLTKAAAKKIRLYVLPAAADIEQSIKAMHGAVVQGRRAQSEAAANPEGTAVAVPGEGNPEADQMNAEVEGEPRSVDELDERKQDPLARALLCIGRLLGRSTAEIRLLLQTIAEEHNRPGKFPKIPANISHRFKIKTDIAAIVFEWMDVVVEALAELADAYCGPRQLFVGGWRKQMADWVKEALSFLHHPSIRVMIGCMAALKEAADLAYSRCNEDDGFLNYKIIKLLEEIVDDYKRIAAQLQVPSSSYFRQYVAAAWPYYSAAFGVPEAQRSVEWLTSVWKESERADWEAPNPEAKFALACFKEDIRDFCHDGVREFR